MCVYVYVVYVMCVVCVYVCVYVYVVYVCSVCVYVCVCVKMSAERLPKMLFFGELRKKRPCHWTKKRWRDLVSRDLLAIGVARRWYRVSGQTAMA